MTENSNLQINTEQENINQNDQEIVSDIKIKTEEDEDLTREVFYFNASNEATNFVRNNQNFEIVGASIPVSEDHMGQLMMNQQANEGDDNKMTVDLGNLLKMHLPDLKDEVGDPAMHYIKYKPDGNGKNVKVWECGICHKEFGHQYILMRHLPTHTDERKYQCKQCGKAFRQMSTLSQHRAIHSKLRPYICEVCQKTFNRVSTLISHRKTHTGMKPHRCHLCNKAFHQKGNLRNHIFTHTNERPYKCDVCSKGFNQMSNLMCHKFKAHQRADKPKYHCPTCGKLFDRRIGLRNHEQYEHGDASHASTVGLFNMVPPGDVATTGGGAATSGGGDMATPVVKYTNGVVVSRIRTTAMKHAMAIGQVPFALLKPIDGVPVLVRVLPAGDKQMLVPATADDLKKYGKLTPKIEPNGDENKENCHVENSTGATVLISIPVVATVIQRRRNDVVCMDIVNPGPGPEKFPSDGESSENYDEDDEEDENEGESSADEKDYANLMDYDDDTAVRHDSNMYEAAASLIDLRTRPQPIEVDQASVEIFNHDEMDIDITNSVIDLEKDHKAYGIIAESGFNMAGGEGRQMERSVQIKKEQENLEVDRLSRDGPIQGEEYEDGKSMISNAIFPVFPE